MDENNPQAPETARPTHGTATDLLARSVPIIERAPVPMVEVIGPTHLVFQLNAAFCHLLGKPKGELIGRRFADIAPGGDECIPILDRVYKTGEAITHTREDEANRASWLYAMWPAMTADQRPAAIIIQLTRAENSHPDASAINEALLISGLRQHELTEKAETLNSQLQAEIIERKKTEAALGEAIDGLNRARHTAEQASRAKDDFLAALSHELRTPLTPVLLAAAALHEDERLPPDLREQLGMMARNIALEARLIDDLLDLTKISHGKFQFRAEACDAHHLIGRAIEIVQTDARAKGITIERVLTARRSRLTADPARFQQVIWNLLRNAVKFTPRGGRISIRTLDGADTRTATWLRIEVTDSGIGIDPARLEQIFQPFDQGGLAGDHRFGGVGLGLAIARSVVDLHGGRISAHSDGPNRGATFVVELPGASEPGPALIDNPAQPTAARRDSNSGLPGVRPVVIPLRLLVVEDHESTLQTLARLLRSDGHQVATASGAGAALAIAAVEKFDLVISDLGLPDGTGCEMMETLRDSHGLRGIALSGYGTEEDIVRSRNAGFATHLVKPVSVATLRRVISSLTQPPPQPHRNGHSSAGKGPK
jgi:signal transduction histidine kinase/ActR/RegA family two-component response regulator